MFETRLFSRATGSLRVPMSVIGIAALGTFRPHTSAFVYRKPNDGFCGATAVCSRGTLTATSRSGRTFVVGKLVE
jgi:hypothetical protein